MIKIEHLSKTFGDLEVLKDVSMEIQKGEVLLFDEPTSALDPEMVKEVLDVIKDLTTTGITMAIVTHEMGFAREVADRICFLDEGYLVENTTPEEFFSNPKSERARQFLQKIL